MLRSVASEQFLLLVRALLLGAALGVVLESFRLYNRFFDGRITRFLQDFLFVFLYMAGVFWLLRVHADGQVRWFVLAAQALGLWLYCKTLGRLLRRPIESLLRMLGRAVCAIMRIVIRPFATFFSVLQELGGRVLKFFGEILKKPFIFLKRYIIMYSIDRLRTIRQKKKGRRSEKHVQKQASEIGRPDVSRFFH